MQLISQETRSSYAHTMAFSVQRYWKLKERQRLSPVARYDEEVLCANWNPEVPLLLQSNGQPDLASNSQRPDHASAIDVDTFRESVYTLAIHL